MASGFDVTTAGGVQFRVLGPVAAARDGATLDLGGPQQRLALALLLSDFGAPRSTDWLIDAIWGEEPPATARKTLQVYVSHLRDALGRDCIEFVSGGYRVIGGWLDATAFEERFVAGRKLIDQAPDDAAALLAGALGLWRGPAFGGFEDTAVLRPEVDRLEELRVTTLEERIAADLAAGATSALVGELESLSREYPWRERFCAQLMLALYRAGRQTDALVAYRRTRDRLVEELGIEPGPELEVLQRHILQHDPALIATRKPATAAPVRAIRGYELREEVDSGSVGRVYRAFDRGANRAVAIKVVPPSMSNRRPYLERFEPTAQLLARLDHPHIVRLDDYWRDSDGAYLVSEWMPGGSLRSALGGGRPWPGEAALTLIEQLGSALAHAHRNGVVHGGLKPENVLLDAAGVAYLADFPLVPSLTGPYVAPELDRPERATPASDIYAFGLLLHELLTGSLPHDGRPSNLLSGELREVVTQAIARAPTDRFARVEEMVRAVRQATGLDVVPAAPVEVATAPVRNPYKGLRAFQEGDAEDFFGRSAMVQRVLDAAANHALVAVVGPSGSGKSSLARAGFIPELRRAAHGRLVLVTEMFPGRHPFEELETALRRVAVGWPEEGMIGDLTADAGGLLRAAERILPSDDSELVLLVDQFEELFSLAGNEDERARFMRCLAAAAGATPSRVRVVITLRADFLDRPLAHADFGSLLEQGLVLLSSPSRRELAQAIRGPARRVGLELEDGLASEVVSDVADQPGALPLMQFALAEMVARGDGRHLTLNGYRHLGGIAGAVGARAEEVYLQQSPAGRAALQQAFFRLVHVDGQRAGTRRRVRRAELAALDVDQVALTRGLQAFAAHRLLTFDRDPITRGATVEVAHEALLVRWPRLRGWVDDRRDDLTLHYRLREAWQEWLASGSRDAFLLAGGRLTRMASWQQASQLQLTSDEQAYLNRSVAAERRRLRRSRRIRLGVGGVAIALVGIGLSLGAVVVQQRSASEHDQIRRLAQTAMSLASSNPEQSLLTSLAAADQARTLDGKVPDFVAEAMHAALMQDRLVATIPQGGLLALSPDGATLAIGAQREVTLWDPSSVTRLADLEPASAALGRLHFSPDGATLIGLDTDGRLERWDLASGSHLASFDTGLSASAQAQQSWLLDVASSQDGYWVAAGRDDGSAVTILDAIGSVVKQLPIDNPTAARFSPDGSRLAVTTAAGAVMFFETGGNWPEIEKRLLTPNESRVTLIDWSASGDRLAVGTQAYGTMVWDIARGVAIQTIPGAFPTALRFDPSGTRLAIGSQDSSARVVDAASGATQAQLNGHANPITGAAFSSDGSRLITSSLDSTATLDRGMTRIWDVSPTGQREIRTLEAHRPGFPTGALTFSADGSLLLTKSLSGEAKLWNTSTWQVMATISGIPNPAGEPAISPDGTSFAIAQGESPAGIVTVMDPRSANWPTTTGIFDTHGKLLMPPLGGHPGTVVGRAFSPDSRSMVTADRGGVINLWDLSTGTELDSQHSQHGGFNRVSFNADGTLVVGGNDDGSFTVWSTANDHLQPLRTVSLPDYAGLVIALFSPDGQRIATTSRDGRGAIWDVSGRRVAELIGHVSFPWYLAWTPDSQTVVTVSTDGTIRVWNAASGALRMTLTGVGVPGGVSVRSDGLMAVASGDDGRIFLYTLDSHELVRLARDRVTRSLTVAECSTFAIDPCPTPAASPGNGS